MSLRVELSCAFCGESASATVEIPGWRVRYDSTGEESAFCPKHAGVEDFFKDQCPGCVAGWPDCPLYRAFAYSRNRELSEPDFASLRGGTCPKRVNGTFMVNNDSAGVRMSEVNLSEPSAAGLAIVSAIRDNIAMYPPDERPA